MPKLLHKEKKALIKTQVQSRKRNYKTRFIPKNSGGYRQIFVYRPFGEEYHSNIMRVKNILDRQWTNENAVGYKKEMSTLKIAKKHQKHNHFYKFDFSDFFPSFKTDIIMDKFKDILQFDDLQYLLWVKDGRAAPFVAQGNPLSPQATNIIMRDFDTLFLKRLKEHFKVKGIKYSRYADDILVSAYQKLDFEVIRKLIQKTLKDTGLKGLKLNEKKSRELKKGGKVIFLGISINKENNYGPTHKYRRRVLSFIRTYQKMLYSNLEYSPASGKYILPLNRIHTRTVSLIACYHKAIYINSISKNKINMKFFKMLKFSNMSGPYEGITTWTKLVPEIHKGRNRWSGESFSAKGIISISTGDYYELRKLTNK